MTVQELIDELQKMDKDANVFMNVDDGEVNELSTVFETDGDVVLSI